MKIFLLLSISILSNGLFLNPAKAQDSTSLSNRKLYLGIMASPDMCNSDVYNGIRIGYTAGINLGYHINESIAIETGVFYTDKGYSSKWNEYFDFDPMDAPDRPPYSTISPGSPIPNDYKINYHFNYIGIPVNVIYQDGELKWKFVANIGGSVDFLINTKQAIILRFENGDKEKETIEFSDDYNPINISLFAGIGVAYGLTKFSTISMIPTFNIGLLEINDPYFETRLWSSGLNIKYSYAIK